MAHKNAVDLFYNDENLPKYSDIKHKFESSNLQPNDGYTNGSDAGHGIGDYFIGYFNKSNEERYIKSNLVVNQELSTRSK